MGPQTSKEEFRDLYYQVYKLRRIPGFPPWGPEWMEKLPAQIVSSLTDGLGKKGGKPLRGLQEPGLADVQPPRSKTPGGLGGTLPLNVTSPHYCSSLGGGDRKAEPVCHLRPAGLPCPLSESGPLKKKITWTKQEAPQGWAGGESFPFFEYSPPW